MQRKPPTGATGEVAPTVVFGFSLSAVALAVTALVVAVESPVWLLATSEEIECEVEKKEIERESRRSLGALMNIRGKRLSVAENIQKKEK